MGLVGGLVEPSDPLEHTRLEKDLGQSLLLWYVTNTVHIGEVLVDRCGGHGVVVVNQE